MSKRAEEFLRLYNSGLSVSAIAKKFKVSKAWVSTVLRSHPDYVARTQTKAVGTYAKSANRALDLRTKLAAHLTAHLPSDQEDELILLAVRLFSRTYPDNMPAPQKILHLLLQVEKLLEQQDWEALKALLPQIQEAQDYIESWAIEIDLNEALAEGVIRTKDGSWIV